MPDIANMTNDEVIAYLKARDSKAAMSALSVVLEKAYLDNEISFVCPTCGSDARVKNGKNKSGVIQYVCKKCGKRYTAMTNTIFEGTDYTWDEMVEAVYSVITKQSVEYLMMNVRRKPIKKQNAWLLYHKILHILAQFDTPILNGVIQIDEKYFRENQKGSRGLISFLDNKTSRKARRHNYRSECGIFGPEFVNVLCATDESGHYYAKCVCLGPMGFEEMADLEAHIGDVSYICTDNLDIYSEWTKQHSWPHYVEPSSYRKERSARGYVNTDDIYRQLSKEDYEKDRKIDEQLYKEGRYPHLENMSRKVGYEEFIAMRYKFNLSINTVNSFHNVLESDIVKSKTGVGSNYLSDFVSAYTFLMNYKHEHDISTFAKRDAEDILKQIVIYTLTTNNSPTREDITNLNVDDLPRPTTRIINEAKRQMKEARKIIKIEKDPEDRDKSEYEGNDTTAQYMFNKRKFFNDIGTIRLNELIKQYGLYKPHLLKKEKINLMCSLPNAQDIIFYEIYLHKYGTIQEFEKAMNALPKRRKRGRPKKNDS